MVAGISDFIQRHSEPTQDGLNEDKVPLVIKINHWTLTTTLPITVHSRRLFCTAYSHLGARFFVRCSAFRGCPYLGGWKCISSMVKSIWVGLGTRHRRFRCNNIQFWEIPVPLHSFGQMVKIAILKTSKYPFYQLVFSIRQLTRNIAGDTPQQIHCMWFKKHERLPSWICIVNSSTYLCMR